LTFAAASPEGGVDGARADDAPIEMTFSNRYPAWSGGFDFTAGTGDTFYDGRIYEEQVGHDVVTEVGPVAEVTLPVSEGVDYWARAKYEVLSPDIHISAHRVIYAMPVTAAMLAPVVDAEPGEPGGPAEPGEPGDPGDGGPGDGTPGAGGPGADDPDDGLAVTGGELLGGALAALLLLGLGAVAALIGRRRRIDLRG
jgi:hypothetical protein